MDQKRIDEILKNSRDEIDIIDKKIVYLLSQRLEKVRIIGKLKKENDIPILQETRFERLLTKLKKYASKLEINPLFIDDIWHRIHKESIKNEN